jgi:CRP/FNR family transcriptional regulator
MTHMTISALAPIEAAKDHGFSNPLQYPAGVTLCHQGESMREVFHVEDGLVKLLRLHACGRERIVGLRPVGWLVGATAAILDEPATVTAVTVTQSRVSRMSAHCFRERLRDDVDLSWRIHRMHAWEIDVGLAHAADLSAISARERLVSFLRGLPPAPDDGASGAHRVMLPLRQWELAQLLGMSAPYLCHLLRDLQRKGTLRRRGALFVLPGERDGRGRRGTLAKLECSHTEA